MCAVVNVTCQKQLFHCHFVDLSSLTLSILEDSQQIHMQNMEQLHAYDCHQNVTEPQATENHIKYTHVYTGTVSQAWL